MKIAIVQDELVRKGGAEQVVISFQNAFPDAPIYTLCYNEKTTYPNFKKSRVITSWFGKFIKDDINLKRFFYPLGVWAMKSLHLKGYDVVLLSTTHCAKYVKIDDKTLVITYCHTPFRLVYRPSSYVEIAHAKKLKSLLYKFIINRLRSIDQKSAKRTNYFITNATEVVPRIKDAYNPKREVTVINPPVKCANFYVSEQIDNYYLVVSRFEPYKKVDLVIRAFNKLSDRNLIIIGQGSMYKDLKVLANSNISFLEGLNAEDLADKFSKCRALIFPQHEDYGITPLEANASGRPVIAYGAGGVLDTMLPYKNVPGRATAVFFKNQTVDSLIDAVEEFEKLNFNPEFIREHAENFDEIVFINKIREFVINKYEIHKNE
ncbi:glycosyltransferase family 4 protein [Agrobacterium tumefaciens]|nr:glycosyltransferase family 4 protein [Agrobacterium tumefaciens]NTE21965.1 glycosyltransferase family 4 protein [Agrobacterium tumefaciens]